MGYSAGTSKWLTTHCKPRQGEGCDDPKGENCASRAIFKSHKPKSRAEEDSCRDGASPPRGAATHISRENMFFTAKAREGMRARLNPLHPARENVYSPARRALFPTMGGCWTSTSIWQRHLISSIGTSDAGENLDDLPRHFINRKTAGVNPARDGVV